MKNTIEFNPCFCKRIPVIVTQVVAECFKVSVNDIIGPSRKQDLMNSRHIAVSISKEISSLTLKEVGRYFGGRDHTTVINSVSKTSDLRDTDKMFKMKYDYCKSKVCSALFERKEVING